MNAAEQLAGDVSVRAVVLHGEGKSFCSGLDVAGFMAGSGGTSVLLTRDGDRQVDAGGAGGGDPLLPDAGGGHSAGRRAARLTNKRRSHPINKE